MIRAKGLSTFGEEPLFELRGNIMALYPSKQRIYKSPTNTYSQYTRTRTEYTVVQCLCTYLPSLCGKETCLPKGA